MAWTPTNAATDVRRIVSNLLAFIDEHQADALAWASPDRQLDNLNLYGTAEFLIVQPPDFPHMGVVRRRVQTEDADDGLRIRYELVFQLEAYAEHTKTDRTEKLAELQADVDNYAYAVESMLLNIPNATLFEGVTGTGHAVKKSVTSYDPLERAISDTRTVFNAELVYVLEFVENP